MFDKWEEKNMTMEEANPLLLTKQAKLVKVEAGVYTVLVKVKKEEKEKKNALARLKKIRDASKGNPPPEAVPPVEGASAGDMVSWEQYKELKGNKVPFELSKLVRTVGNKNQRLAVMSGQITLSAGRNGDVDKVLFIQAKNHLYYADPRKLIRIQITKGKETITYHKLEFDVNYAEAMDATGNIEWDDTLEMILADSVLDQYVVIAASDEGFKLSPTLKKVLMILFGLGIMLGISINGAYHVVPTTQIHWVP